jgi:hypothetical protein
LLRVRRLEILQCPVPEALDRGGPDTDRAARWCDHCACHVNHSRDLDAEEFEALIHSAASSRVCMQIELEGRRPKLRSAVAANVLVVALAGCASTTALAPANPPQVFVDSERLPAGGSQITGFVIGEDGCSWGTWKSSSI